MAALIEFKSLQAISENNVDPNEIIDILPPWKTLVLEAFYAEQETFPKLQITFLIEANNSDDIKKWIQELEDHTKTKYSIRKTYKCRQRVEFKQDLVCHHFTRHQDAYVLTKENHNTRNTNCPSSLTVILHAIKKRYRGKYIQKHELLKKMPCEIIYKVSHNHSIGTADSLRFRKVSDEVKLQLLELFHAGHSPASALESIKTDIQLNNDNYEELLADRKFCPTYPYCYQLYKKEFKKLYGPLEFNESTKDSLLQKLESFNAKMHDVNSARMIYHGTDAYAICICPPLFKRVHKNIEASSELVFIDSTGNIDHDGNRLFILLTHSECGGLPLGIIITSSEDHVILSKGLELLKEMMGNDLFYGNCEGPVAFITDDLPSKQLALKMVWPKSKHLLCIFHVLQCIWRWLISGENNICKEKQVEFFHSFRKIMYSNSIEECEKNYAIALSNAENFTNYLEYLREYWKRRELWAKSFRNGLFLKGNHNNYSEAAMKVIKDQILERMKTFNIVQMVDFLSTKFIRYYESRLLDAAHNRKSKIFNEKIPVPPPGILKKIIFNGDMALVPDEKENMDYTVNLKVNICECSEGNTGSYCKHFYWATMISSTTKPNSKSIKSLHLREIYYKIATGKSPQGKLQSWCANQKNEKLIASRKQYFSTFSSTNTYCVTQNNDNNEQYVATDSSSSENYCDPQKNEEDDMQKENTQENSNVDVYFDTTEKLQNTFKEFIKKSPNEVGPSILKLLKTINNIKSASTFASYNFSYGEGSSRISQSESINAQPTSFSRRKVGVVGHPGKCRPNLDTS